MLVIIVINVDAYPFFGFLKPDLSTCTVPLDSRETELGSSNQESTLSAYKNTGVALVPCCA